LNQPLSISIIGGGNVGKALGRLWHAAGVVEIRDVMCRTLDSAARATGFIGAGRAVADYADLQRADIYMITTSDDRIASSCAALAAAGLLGPASVAFHCSGARQSTELAAAHAAGAAVASIHPIRSFASPDTVAADFSGTYCGVEGDPRALDALMEPFAAIGARFVPIDADRKILYHAAAVFASNYLPTLLASAQQAYAAAGISPGTALEMMEQLVRETVDNVFRLGPAGALGGPIARGDTATVEKQQSAVSAWNEEYGKLYAQFAELTTRLAATRARH
jgi:predicted short-subunit dehydrogenase-like oxidoreductase (DUF2520 family)